MGIKRIIGRSTAAGAAGVLALTALTAGGTATAAEDTAPVFACSYTDWDLDYAPTASLSQSGTGLTLTLSAFPAIAGVPSFVTVSKVVGKVSATVDGGSVALAGTQVVDPATPMANGFPVPALTGTLPAGLADTTMTIADLDFTVTAMGGEHDITCEVVAPGSFAVAATPAAKVASKTTAKVKVNKKRVATVAVTVKGKAGTPKGKVSLVVAKGKKTVQKKTVKLTKKGVATAKLKKLAKGKYSVTAKYAGDKSYVASKKKVTFKVK